MIAAAPTPVFHGWMKKLIHSWEVRIWMQFLFICFSVLLFVFQRITLKSLQLHMLGDYLTLLPAPPPLGSLRNNNKKWKPHHHHHQFAPRFLLQESPPSFKGKTSWRQAANFQLAMWKRSSSSPTTTAAAAEKGYWTPRMKQLQQWLLPKKPKRKETSQGCAHHLPSLANSMSFCPSHISFHLFNVSSRQTHTQTHTQELEPELCVYLWDSLSLPSIVLCIVCFWSAVVRWSLKQSIVVNHNKQQECDFFVLDVRFLAFVISC